MSPTPSTNGRCVPETYRVLGCLVGLGGAIRGWPPTVWRAVVIAQAMAIVLVGGERYSQADMVETFEGPDSSWALAESDCQASIATQQRRLSGAHSGQGCEFLRVAMAQGTRVYLTHKIPPSSMIAEWRPSVWVKSDRQGLQMLVRVVLPRTIDRRNGRPLTTLLGGSTYQNVGTWQELTLTEPLVLLDRQVRVLRTQWDQPIDPRQAYADMIVINAHGGATVTNLWVDDLELRGLVQVRNVTETDRAWASDRGPNVGGERSSDVDVAGNIGAASVSASSRDIVPAAAWSSASGFGEIGDESMSRSTKGISIQGSLLMIGRRPMMPRVARWRGEPFDWLKELGFNTVLLPHVPTRQQQQEAAHRDLWLIAPPPARFDEHESADFQRVVAWNLGTQLGLNERETTRERARSVRRYDPLAHRPILCGGDATPADYSRIGDVLVSGAWSRTGRLGLDGVAHGPLRETRNEILRDVPLWADIFLPAPVAAGGDEPSSLSQARSASNGVRSARHSHPAADQSISGQDLIDIRWAVYDALSDGSKAIMLSPADSLEPGRDELKPLLKTVRTLNDELMLIEPWVLSEPGVEDARVSDDRYRVRVLEHPRARLAIVMREPRTNEEFSNGTVALNRVRLQLPSRGVRFVDTGAHGADEAYEITPSGLKRLRRTRVTGGVEVELDQTPALALVVLTSEPLVVSYLSRQLARR